MFPDSKLTVLCTDLREPEALLLQLAEEERRQTPNRFAGKKPGVFFRWHYVPPYEKFPALRQLLLRVKEATGLRAEFRGVVAIDATEWLGHEREEYFTVILKYLYDHRNAWLSAFVLCDGTAAQQRRLAAACSAYITPVMEDGTVFTNKDRLSRLLLLRFHDAERTILRSTLNRVTDLLSATELTDARSLALLDRVVEDLAALSARKKVVSIETVHQYLSDPDSTLTMLMGGPERAERSSGHGIETVLL